MMPSCRQYPLTIIHTLLRAGISVDHFDGVPDHIRKAVLNKAQDDIIEAEVSKLKNQGYYLVGYYNTIPMCIRDELKNTPGVQCQILNHYCWLEINREPLRSDVILVNDDTVAVLLKLIAADELQFLGVHKK